MISLPNSLPTPKPWNHDVLTPQLLSLRASLAVSTPSSHSESVRYVVKLEDYLEGLFDYLSTLAPPAGFTTTAQKSVLCDTIPWNNVEKKKPVEWTLSCEIDVVLVAIALTYSGLGADLTNELIELEPGEPQKETDEKWKLVIAYHKKAIGFALFGAQFTAGELDPRTYVLIDKISQIGIQMSMLSKFSTANRNSFNENDTFNSSNNGVLCRVAIFCSDEVSSCMNLVNELDSEHYELNHRSWNTYLAVIKRYATAYAGLFLSIEYYQKDKVGQAIGLINFSLLTLQSKSMDIKPKKKRVLSRFRTKIASKRNEHYIAGLQLITALKIDKLVFLELSGVVLKDLSFLFDQLVQCHLKYTKENDNLRFDQVVDWKDIHSDSRWPFGSKIPVSLVEPWTPKILAEPANVTGSGSYY